MPVKPSNVRAAGTGQDHNKLTQIKALNKPLGMTRWQAPGWSCCQRLTTPQAGPILRFQIQQAWVPR